MHVLIDGRGLENKIDGIGQYVLNTVIRLPRFTTARYTVLVQNDLARPLPPSPNVTYLKTCIKRFSLDEGIGLRRVVSKVAPDLYFNFSSYVPGKIPCRQSMMVHDLLSTHFRGNFRGLGVAREFLARSFFRYQMRKSIREADRIVTNSIYSRDKICHYYVFDKRKIAVAYGGVDERFYLHDGGETERKISPHYVLPEKFFLHVGNLKPYKNIDNIIRSYARFRDKHPTCDVGLVFTGGRGRGYREAKRLIDSLNLNRTVKIVGHIDESDLAFVYAGSVGLFFPSLEEGLGLPVLEAMCCKTPVVTSRGTATEEIAGGHAFLVDPRSIESLVGGLEHLAFKGGDPNTITVAYEYAKKFTWDRTVALIMESLLET